MTPTMMRQLWSLIETTQTHLLLRLDDASLVQCLLKRYKQEQPLAHEEMDVLSDYLNHRVPLIRDIAQQRQAAANC